MSRRARAKHRAPRPQQSDRIVLRATDTLGTAAAENDQLLRQCFVDTGYLESLADTSPASPCIVVGRTGSGKSALLIEFERRHKAIRLAPESLALNHVSRSTIIGKLAEIGVRLEPFYKLLWRQFFCIHALAARFDSMSGIDRWFAGLKPQLRRARAYLEEWAGKDFFEKSQVVSEQLLRTLESKVTAGLRMKGLGIEHVEGITTQLREELVPICQDVITRDLAEQLQAVMQITRNVFEDIDPIYFVIDGLDEDWVQEDQRHLLIMGLIQTLSDMRGIPNSKIVAAIRRDLLEEVYVRARPIGFQEEKLQDMYLPVHWSRDDLARVLDERINALLRDRYSGRVKVGFRDVFPDNMPVGSQKPRTIEYLLTRTQMRPRDLISFVNHIVRKAKGSAITITRIREAEKKYSTERLKSVADEWHMQEPYLDHLARAVLRDRPSRFVLATLNEQKIRDKALSYALQGTATNPLVQSFANGGTSYSGFIEQAIQRLYRYGVIRLKPRPDEKFRSGLDDDAPDEIEELGPETRVSVHPMFWQALNTHITEDAAG